MRWTGSNVANDSDGLVQCIGEEIAIDWNGLTVDLVRPTTYPLSHIEVRLLARDWRTLHSSECI